MKKKYDLSKHTELIARPYNLPLNSIVRLITGALPTISERTRKLFYRHLRHFPPQWSKNERKRHGNRNSRRILIKVQNGNHSSRRLLRKASTLTQKSHFRYGAIQRCVIHFPARSLEPYFTFFPPTQKFLRPSRTLPDLREGLTKTRWEMSGHGPQPPVAFGNGGTSRFKRRLSSLALSSKNERKRHGNRNSRRILIKVQNGNHSSRRLLIKVQNGNHYYSLNMLC